MTTTRRLHSALFLVPLGLLASHTAGAAGSLRPAPAGEPGAVASLPDGVHAVGVGRYTRDLCDQSKGAGHCMSRVLMPEGWKPGDRNPYGPQGIRRYTDPMPGSMGPTDITTAYNIPSGTAANGKIVAILDMYDSHAWNDLNTYRQAYGLGTLPKCNGSPTGGLPACFQQVAEDGSAASGPDGGDSVDSETSLDMDMISAACPDCSILIVNFPEFTDQDAIAATATAAGMGASAVSISWGVTEKTAGAAGGNPGNDPTGNNYTTAGTLVLAAAGDWGYLMTNQGGPYRPSYPASAPDVLAVGGTNLFSLGGSSYDEAVWDDGIFQVNNNGQDVTTSGCSTEYAMPTWQSSALAGTGCTHRATADVSAAAAFTSGGTLGDIAVYEQGFGWMPVEGTSASSPMLAAILTRLNLTDTIASNLGWEYANAAAWNDLGSSKYPVDSNGSNTDSPNPGTCGKLCTAGPGWDGPSGLGTPNGEALWALSSGGGVDAGPPPVSTAARVATAVTTAAPTGA